MVLYPIFDGGRRGWSRTSGPSPADQAVSVAVTRYAFSTLVAGIGGGQRIDHARPTAVAATSATGLATDTCGVEGRTGRLRPGLDADLILVAGDAVGDVTALRELRVVVSRGRLVTLPAP